MKRLLLIIIVFFSFFDSVIAKEDIVLNSLEITNGEISPRFDKYNNYYSVKVDKSVKKLEFMSEYDINKYDIKIGNNDNIVNNKLIYITIFDKKTLEQNTYILKVYIEESEKEVMRTSDIVKEVSIKKQNYDYAPLIGAICFALIILIFRILFL